MPKHRQKEHTLGIRFSAFRRWGGCNVTMIVSILMFELYDCSAEAWRLTHPCPRRIGLQENNVGSLC